jgi:hypothetical protein
VWGTLCKLFSQERRNVGAELVTWSKDEDEMERIQVSFALSQAQKQVTSAPMWERQIFDRILNSTERRAEAGGASIDHGQHGVEGEVRRGHGHAGDAVSETAGNVAAMIVKLDKLQVDVAQQAVKLEAASHRQSVRADEMRKEIRDMQSKQDRDLRSILRHLEGGHHHVDQRPPPKPPKFGGKK